MGMYMNIPSILENLNYLKRDVGNLKRDVEILGKATQNIQNWDDSLREQINLIIVQINKKIDFLIFEFNKLLKSGENFTKDVQQNYLKKINI